MATTSTVSTDPIRGVQPLRAGQGMLEVILHHNPLKAFLAFAFVPLIVACVVALLPFAATPKVIAIAAALGTGCMIFALGMASVAVSGADRRR